MNWKFWAWRRDTETKSREPVRTWLHDLFEWERKMEAAGFRPYMAEVPPFGVPLELMRREWATVYVTTQEELRPESNVADLWWRAANGPVISGTQIFDLSLMAPRGSA